MPPKRPALADRLAPAMASAKLQLVMDDIENDFGTMHAAVMRIRRGASKITSDLERLLATDKLVVLAESEHRDYLLARLSEEVAKKEEAGAKKQKESEEKDD